VLSEAYHWNWTARINGSEAKTLPVNGALLGVYIPAGTASVEFSYRPSELIAGAAISALTVLAMTAALWIDRSKSRKP
jgi:uncharacterized membrane protein YfhO